MDGVVVVGRAAPAQAAAPPHPPAPAAAGSGDVWVEDGGGASGEAGEGAVRMAGPEKVAWIIEEGELRVDTSDGGVLGEGSGGVVRKAVWVQEAGGGSVTMTDAGEQGGVGGLGGGLCVWGKWWCCANQPTPSQLSRWHLGQETSSSS